MVGEREKGLEKLIEEVWWVFLDKIKKEKVPRARSELGDEVDLFLPQIRALFMMQNPVFPKIIYGSSYRGAKRIAHRLARKKADMQPDILCNLIFMTNKQALEKLSGITNEIFSEIMKINKEGLLSVTSVSTDPPEHIKIILKLEDCAECFGVEANHPICYYHAGTLTGIVSSLLDKKLYGYETECCATGGDKCEFIIQDNSEGHNKYLNPGKIDFSLDKRLKDTLGGENPRSIGNEIDLGYYQLVILNSLITNPKIFSEASRKVGKKYGKSLALFLQTYHNKREEELFDDISKYYQDLKHLQIEIKTGADEIRAEEVAEISGLPKNVLFLEFLFGELEGLLSVIRKEEVTCKDKKFENDDLVITFKKQE